MAKIFLDTNCFLILLRSDGLDLAKKLAEHELSISVLSVHIAVYIQKIKVPHSFLIHLLENITLISLDEIVIQKSLYGPTTDLEDNIQLCSALDSGTDIFLTRDKQLLKLGAFESIPILSPDQL